MTLRYTHNGETREFECSGDWASRWTAQKILIGESYIPISFVEDVRVVMDIGANCGAASVFFAMLYPDATILAFEPAREPYALLRANTDHLDNVRTYNIGFHATDQRAPLYHGAGGSGDASIFHGVDTLDDYELVTLRSVPQWLEEQSIDRIDVLKIDTEGCEVPILDAMRDRLGSIKAIYFEYHQPDDLRELDQLLAETHVLAAGRMWVSWGEAAYVAKDAFPEDGMTGPTVRDWIAESVSLWSPSRQLDAT